MMEHEEPGKGEQGLDAWQGLRGNGKAWWSGEEMHALSFPDFYFFYFFNFVYLPFYKNYRK